MPTHYIQANTNGRLHPASDPSISPLNRGFLYGDAIYEVWRTYHGVIFAWEQHWKRLRASAQALHMRMAFAPEQILSEIRRAVFAYRAEVPGSGELYIRLQITRGAGAIGLDVELAESPDFVLLVQPCPETPAEKLLAGLRLSTATSLRRNPVQSLDPAWKTGNYLNNLLCLREARARGADDVVILNLAGEVAEAAVANIAFVRGGRLVTPPLAAGILGGVTRGLLLDGIAASAGIAGSEETVRPEDLRSMDECFLLSTTKDIVPVREIDDIAFRLGPASVVSRLKTAFAAAARSYALAHPELAI
ncbi:MAG TPA: aminotransferase class IV [Opitutaceae bacterium]|nr:aminotransferase class IV [Opitutaceae bacterium]